MKKMWLMDDFVIRIKLRLLIKIPKVNDVQKCNSIG